MIPSFPSNYFIKIILKDGTEVLFRPITSNDDDLLLEGFYELSDESRYYRFFCWKQDMSMEEVKQYTNIDYENNFALGAFIKIKDVDDKLREKGIGVARFIRDLQNPSTAEMAVVVIDNWQRKGCGSQLLLNLIRIAKQKGIQWVVGYTVPQNIKIFDMLRKSGYKIQFKTSEGITSFKFKI
ncbi:MAG: GNAT family N-acetyltransferase [Promethearchaeota archaeon]